MLEPNSDCVAQSPDRRAFRTFGWIAAPIASLCILWASPVWTQKDASIPESERLALLRLYETTEGPYWTESDGWRDAARNRPAAPGTECDWHGVECDPEGLHVTAIVLEHNNLAGKLPDLGALRHIKGLRLGRNRLVGPLPGFLWRLTSLEELALEWNGFSGHLSTDACRPPRLAHLELSGNNLSGSVPALDGCRALIFLGLARNRFSGTLPTLRGARSLEFLALEDNGFGGRLPSSWSALASLELLSISGNELRGPIPDAWSRLKEVVSFSASRNRLSGQVPAWLLALESLRNLDLSRNLLSGPIPAALESPERIDLSHNRLSGPVPSSMFDAALKLDLSFNELNGVFPAIERFPQHTDLSHNMLTGEIPSSVDVDYLEWLSVSGNRLTGELPMNILESDARSLDLSNNRFRGSVREDWAPSQRLESLNLASNELIGNLPPALLQGTSLLAVDVRNNRFVGGIPTQCEAKALQVLRLSGNTLTGTLAVVSPEATPWLAWLDVRENRFSGGLDGVARLRVLEAFDGSGNPWSSDVPASLLRLSVAPDRGFSVVRREVLIPSDSDLPRRTRPLEIAREHRALERAEDIEGDPAPDGSRSTPEILQTIVIAGVVTDLQGGVIPGVAVTATSPRGDIYSTVTGADGTFRISVPAPGMYKLSASTAGFMQKVQEVLVLAGQSQTVTIQMGVGGLTEPVIVSSDSRPPSRAWWNTSISREEEEESDPEYLEPEGRYQFILELASDRSRRGNGGSRPISRRLQSEIERLVRKQRWLSLTVRVLVLGRAVELAPRASRVAQWEHDHFVPVIRDRDVAVLRIDLRRLVQADGIRIAETAAELVRERFAAIRVGLDAKEAGCSVIVASIWNDDETVPLDQVVHAIGVGKAAACEPVVPSPDTGDPLGLYGNYGRVHASLQSIELDVDGMPTTVSLLSVPGENPCPMYGWQTVGTLSGSIFQTGFRTRLDLARMNDATEHYAKTATSIRNNVFSGTTRIPGCGAGEALAAIRMASTQGEVDMLMRVVDKSGRLLFPPLGLLSLAVEPGGARTFKHHINPIAMLPVQTLGAASCVETWGLVLPAELRDARDEVLTSVPTPLENEPLLRTRDTFENYMREQDGEAAPMGLVLLAHHLEGYLYFGDENDVLEVRPLGALRFGAGSVAVLSACASAAVGDTSPLIHALNKAGIDSFVMSPFEIRTDFGGALAQEMAVRIVAAGKEGARTSLRELYRGAQQAAKRRFVAPEFAEELVEGWALEFVMAGNPDAPVCWKREVEVRR